MTARRDSSAESEINKAKEDFYTNLKEKKYLKKMKKNILNF